MKNSNDTIGNRTRDLNRTVVMAKTYEDEQTSPPHSSIRCFIQCVKKDPIKLVTYLWFISQGVSNSGYIPSNDGVRN